ncbi:MAG: peptide ABC transporter substrate-binding protein [Candidatus Sumerlaeia bacterium]|nr:peptide ABC transporter substrate-binding protein [Candidatus Sumerlaeia bacterium]
MYPRILPALIAIFAILAPAFAQRDAAGGPDRTLRVNVGTPPETIDTAVMTGIPESRIANFLQEGLVSVDAESKPLAAAAVEWEHNDAFTEWTFRLRPGMKWHNGDPVTAHDFVFGVRRILDPRTQGKYADMVTRFLKGGADYYKNREKTWDTPFEGVEATDDLTVVYRLNFPAPFFPTVVSHTSFFPQNRKVVEAGGRAWANDVKTYVGNGPFRLVEHRLRDRMVLAKADTYWDKDAIWMNEVVIRMIEDENTELAAFERRELDVTNTVPLTEVPRLKQTPEWFVGPYLGTYYVAFNTTKAPFDNRDVRMAFSAAIQRDVIVERITRRGEQPGSGIVPAGVYMPDGTNYRERAGRMTPEFSVEKARELLKKAGFGPGGKPFPAATYTYNTLEEHKIIGEQLQSMWRTALGVPLRLENVEWKEKLRRGREQDFQLMRNAWIADYVDPMSFLEIFLSDDGNNDGKYNNPKFDETVHAAARETDPEKRYQLLIEAERILMDDAAVAPIYHYVSPRLIQADVKGIVQAGVGNLYMTKARRE